MSIRSATQTGTPSFPHTQKNSLIPSPTQTQKSKRLSLPGMKYTMGVTHTPTHTSRHTPTPTHTHTRMGVNKKLSITPECVDRRMNICKLPKRISRIQSNKRSDMYKQTQKDIYTRVKTHTPTPTRRRISTYTPTQTYTPTHTQTYTPTHTQTYTPNHTYTYTHTNYDTDYDTDCDTPTLSTVCTTTHTQEENEDLDIHTPIYTDYDNDTDIYEDIYTDTYKDTDIYTDINTHTNLYTDIIKDFGVCMPNLKSCEILFELFPQTLQIAIAYLQRVDFTYTTPYECYVLPQQRFNDIYINKHNNMSIDIQTHTQKNIHDDIHMYTHTHKNINKNIHKHIDNKNIYKNINTYTENNINTYTHKNIHMYTHTQKPTLVLDLDETLIHCAKSKIHINNNKNTQKNNNTQTYKNTNIHTQEPHFLVHFEGYDMPGYIYVRPYACEFLKAMSMLYEVVIFTASTSPYANQVLDKLDPENEYIHHRLYREHCTFQKGGYVKDLNTLGRSLKHTILVDNSPISAAFQLDNFMPISSWYGDDNDTELKDLAHILTTMAEVPNVVKWLSRRYGFRDWINAYREVPNYNDNADTL